MTTLTATAVATVVRRYLATVADLTSTEAELRELLDPSVRVAELPNLLTRDGAVRDLEGTLVGFRAGKALLREQAIDVHDLLVDGDRAAVRLTWSGTVGVDAGGFTAGTRLVAHIAGFLTVRDGRVVEHSTYDCYEPFSRTVPVS